MRRGGHLGRRVGGWGLGTVWAFMRRPARGAGRKWSCVCVQQRCQMRRHPFNIPINQNCFLPPSSQTHLLNIYPVTPAAWQRIAARSSGLVFMQLLKRVLQGKPKAPHSSRGLAALQVYWDSPAPPRRRRNERGGAAAAFDEVRYKVLFLAGKQLDQLHETDTLTAFVFVVAAQTGNICLRECVTLSLIFG